jgi:hypothetical protein
MDDFDQIEQGLSDIERFAHNLLLESVSSTVVAGEVDAILNAVRVIRRHADAAESDFHRMKLQTKSAGEG